MPRFYVKEVGKELRHLFMDFIKNDREDFLRVLAENELRYVRIPHSIGSNPQNALLTIEYEGCTKQFAIELFAEILRRYKKYLDDFDKEFD